MALNPTITTREQLAPAIHTIKIEVYETARRERWSVSELQEQTQIALQNFANQLDAEAKFEWARVVRQLMGQPI